MITIQMIENESRDQTHPLEESRRIAAQLLQSIWQQETTPEDRGKILVITNFLTEPIPETIDLLVLGRFTNLTRQLRFQTGGKSGQLEEPPLRTVNFRDFCLCIQLVHGSVAEISSQGRNLLVKKANQSGYNATQKSTEQVRALRGFFEYKFGWSPAIRNQIWLTQLDRSQLPDYPRNLLPTRPSFTEILEKLCSQFPPQFQGTEGTVTYYLSASTKEGEEVKFSQLCDRLGEDLLAQAPTTLPSQVQLQSEVDLSPAPSQSDSKSLGTEMLEPGLPALATQPNSPVAATSTIIKPRPFLRYGLPLLALLALPVAWLGYQYTQFTQRARIQPALLRIGILTDPEKHKTLSAYLQEQLIPDNFINYLQGEKLQIVVEGDPQLSYQQAKDKIATKVWDIAFTESPMIAVAAKDNNYTFAARMYPQEAPYYQSVLFVRSDSPIRALSDLRPTTVIALGNFNSASSFFMPVYDLYGKTFNLRIGNRSSEIRQLVKGGQVEVGAGAEVVIRKDPQLRVIHVSRNIPGSGVYLSPQLSPVDRETIQRTLLSAPENIKVAANFGAGEELDYSEFIKIVRRLEGMLSCVDWQRTSVQLFCP
uniref:ABC-type phosphate/phosphonate transport system periplasmic component-like protein n=1 Tax=Cyanothece sp. (strain PCC 7425 / ATCC 29141) TaxID=395961 RepID=B8HSV5_CYAP4